MTSGDPTNKNCSVKNKMKTAFLMVTLLFGLVGCDRNMELDEAAIRAWAASPEVVSRSTPAIYGDHDSKGRYLAVGTGNFMETSDGIDIGDQATLKTGFYVFPGKIHAADIEEAIRIMKNLKRGSISVD